MIITSIKNDLNIVLYSTVDFTRSKLEKIAKFIFQNSCNLLRCIRDNPNVTLASSTITMFVGTMAEIPALTIIGIALIILNSIFTELEQLTSEHIARLREKINSLDAEYESKINSYNQIINSSESIDREDYESFINRNREEIEDCQITIDELQLLRNW